MKELAREKKQFELARTVHQATRPKSYRIDSSRTPKRVEKPEQNDLGWDRWLPINFDLG